MHIQNIAGTTQGIFYSFHGQTEKGGILLSVFQFGSSPCSSNIMKGPSSALFEMWQELLYAHSKCGCSIQIIKVVDK
jgi:hypothetical protein